MADVAFSVNSPLALANLNCDDVLYVADEHLNVVLVNQHWHAFAEQNNGKAAFTLGAKANLLDSFSGSERSRWRAIYQSLIDGHLPFYESHFLCPSPYERRALVLRVERHLEKGAGRLLLVHRIVRDVQEPLTNAEAAAAYDRLVSHRVLNAPGFAIASSLEPLMEVGGDLIWCQGYGTGVADFVVADATGHGIAAAHIAVRVAAILDEVAVDSHSVAATVTRLNAQLSADRLSRRGSEVAKVDFATGLYVRMDRNTRATTMCSFGHPGAVFSRTGYVQPAPGLPVGIDTNATWVEQQYSFDEYGSQLVLFTDGITEQFNAAGEMLGHARLAQIFLEHLPLPQEQRLQKLRTELAAFRGEALIKDDQALLLVDAFGVN